MSIILYYIDQNIISATNRKIKSQFNFHYFRVDLSEKNISLLVPKCYIYTPICAAYIKRKQIKQISWLYRNKV